MSEISKDRQEILNKIADYEKRGLFDVDVENDPPTIPLKLGEVDFLNKNLRSKINTAFAYRAGRLFYEKMLKNSQFELAGVIGIENLSMLQGGALITCNHFSIYDNYAIQIALKTGAKQLNNKKLKKAKLYKIIREGNYNLPGKIGFFVRHAHTLPLSQNPKVMVECMNAVQTLFNKNHFVLIYPEQSMWWNYRKPKPLKVGAFKFAAKANKPVLPMFITMQDTNKLDSNNYPVQAYTVNILPPIYPKPELSTNENAEHMKNENHKLWVETYEKVYNKKLEFTTEKQPSELIK